MLPFILTLKRFKSYFDHQALTKTTLYIERCNSEASLAQEGLSLDQCLLIFDQWGSKVIPRLIV